jgi:uncharacterized protein YgiM (DUF1202 family)
MRLVLSLVLLLLLAACSSSTNLPPAETATAEPEAAVEESVIGTVRVTASSLNVRGEPSADGELLTTLRRGTSLGVVRTENGWSRVRLADGRMGWVLAKHVRANRGCEADRDFRMLAAPPIAFVESSSHGVVTVEADVSTAGLVTKTKTVGNTTGDPALALVAEKEIRAARFEAPVRNCKPQRFIYVYRKTF